MLKIQDTIVKTFQCKPLTSCVTSCIFDFDDKPKDKNTINLYRMSKVGKPNMISCIVKK